MATRNQTSLRESPLFLVAFLVGSVLLIRSVRGQPITERPLVLQQPGMHEVEARSIVYKIVRDTTLRADVYYPPEADGASARPVVLFINGVGSMSLPDWRGYQDWARLVALRGLVAIHYQSRRSKTRDDTEDVIAYVRRHAGELGIDATRIGVFASSANVTVGFPLAMQPDRPYIRAVAIYYGMADVEPVRQDLPFFIVRAGLDSYGLNDSIDQFIAEALSYDLDLRFVNYLRGQHAFDVLDDTERSREIIEQTLDFFETNLADSASPEADTVFTAKSFYALVAQGDVERAMRRFREAHARYRADAAFNSSFNRATAESSLNQIGYQLMDEGKPDAALAVVELMVETYPDSPNAYDSMADAYEAAGMPERAIEYSEKALQMLEEATDVHERLKKRIREHALDRLSRLKQ